MNQSLLEMKNITKSFSGNLVLKAIDFSVCKGEVHGLIGENGAGKSTLMNVLSGLVKQDEGTIRMNGELMDFNNISDSQENGIGFIHQELSLVPNLTIQQNFFLGNEITKNGRLDFKTMNKKTIEGLSRLNLSLNPSTPIEKLSIAQQQLVEIAKVISFNSDLIIMDEPTTSLTTSEVEELFIQIDNLRNNGISIIFISHKLEELLYLSDRITVLRDGEKIATVNSNDIDEDKLIELMVGRELTDMFIDKPKVSPEEILRVENLSNNYINDVSFSLNKGEILGVAGLVGSGRSELAYTLFGIYSQDDGEIYLNNQKVEINSSQDAIKNGIALVTEDRKDTGLFLGQEIEFNILLPSYKNLIYKFQVKEKEKNEILEKGHKNLSIKMTGFDQLAVNLSGGNQQKVVLAKWLATNPDILILDEPTKGIDVGSKNEIYKIISRLASEGVAILMISSEMNEILNLSHRVLVMGDGTLRGIIEEDSKEFTQEGIMQYAMGGTKIEQNSQQF